MRRLLLVTGVLLTAFALSCSTKPPAAPGSVIVTQTTTSTTTSIPTTTSTTSTTTSTIPAPADLALFTPTGNFCRTQPNGDLFVQYVNQASGTAGPFVVRLSYQLVPNGPTTILDMPQGGATPGMLVDLTFPNTAACGRSTTNCTFVINIDADGTVTETNEGNNVAVGKCPPI
jgi:hypothetical protein